MFPVCSSTQTFNNEPEHKHTAELYHAIERGPATPTTTKLQNIFVLIKKRRKKAKYFFNNRKKKNPVRKFVNCCVQKNSFASPESETLTIVLACASERRESQTLNGFVSGLRMFRMYSKLSHRSWPFCMLFPI